VETRPANPRLRELVAVSLALSAELSLDALLQKIVGAAATLTRARYGALGVIDESGSALERFVTTGMDADERTQIGGLPRGQGILGVLIRDASPLRLARLGNDPRSCGFPPGHPPMESFLGVPLMLRGVAYGNLYLTEKAGGDEFDDEDEEILTLLAAQAAVAIENARLYASATLWSRQLESLHEVVRSMVEEIELASLLELVCQRVRELINARIAFVALVVDDRQLEIAAAVTEDEPAPELVGHRLDRAQSKAGYVLDEGHSARVDSLLDDPDVDQGEGRALRARTGLYVPLKTAHGSLGVLVVHDKLGADARFTDADLRLVEIFAARAAVAIALSRQVARETVRRVVDAQESERRRLALELHDETGQALTSILLGLKSIRAAGDEAEAEQAEADVRALVVQALQDVRALAVELRPAALDDFGVGPALERLAHTFGERSGVRVSIDAGGGDRLPAEIETTLYRVVQEALTNVVKHAGATYVSIVLEREVGGVTLTVTDDGTGFERARVREDALGLLGMRERLALVGGSLIVGSQSGEGTTVRAHVPLAASS